MTYVATTRSFAKEQRPCPPPLLKFRKMYQRWFTFRSEGLLHVHTYVPKPKKRWTAKGFRHPGDGCCDPSIKCVSHRWHFIRSRHLGIFPKECLEGRKSSKENEHWCTPNTNQYNWPVFHTKYFPSIAFQFTETVGNFPEGNLRMTDVFWLKNVIGPKCISEDRGYCISLIQWISRTHSVS